MRARDEGVTVHSGCNLPPFYHSDPVAGTSKGLGTVLLPSSRGRQVVALPAPPGAPLENVRLVLCLVCNLLMQIMLGNADQHRPAMQFDSFEDGRQW